MAILAIKTKTVENPFRIQGLISVLWLHLTLLQNMISKSGTKTQMNHTQLYSKQYMQIQEEDSQTSLSGMRVNLRLHHSFAEMFQRLESKDEPSCTIALENQSVQIQKIPHWKSQNQESGLISELKLHHSCFVKPSKHLKPKHELCTKLCTQNNRCGWSNSQNATKEKWKENASKLQECCWNKLQNLHHLHYFIILLTNVLEQTLQWSKSQTEKLLNTRIGKRVFGGH